MRMRHGYFNYTQVEVVTQSIYRCPWGYSRFESEFIGRRGVRYSHISKCREVIVLDMHTNAGHMGCLYHQGKIARMT